MTTPEPRDEDVSRLEQQARDLIASYQTFLASPAFQHQIDVAVLVKVAGDERAPARERLRAAEVLAKLRLDAMAAVADLLGVREQSLDRLGIKQGPQSLALTQVNQKIEIVRAKDWRAAAAIDEGEVIDVEALPSGEEPDGEDPPP